MQAVNLLLIAICIVITPIVRAGSVRGGGYRYIAANKASSALAPKELKAVIRAALEKFSIKPNAVLEVLQENKLIPISPLNSKKENTLHLLADMQMDENTALAAFRALVQDDTSLDVVDKDGRGILHRLAEGGRFKMTEFALSKGARADLRDDSDKLPSHYAREGEHEDLAALLDMYAKAKAKADDPDYVGAIDIEDGNVGEQNTVSAETTIAPMQADSVPATEEIAVIADEEDLPDFLVNLNRRALAGEIDPLIGRVEEVRRMLEVLGQRHSNNPVLVGLPGVGKTAIVEGLAYLIAKGEVPPRFSTKTIYEVNISALTAGTGVRGSLEEKVAQLVKFAEQHPEAIFFIDEVHHITSGDTGGGVNIADQLKPALASGKLPLIGATTDDEFRQHIAKFGALERRFVRINVGEPSEAEVIDIVLGTRDLISVHQDIEITDEAVLAAVELAQYFKDQQRPFSAIRLLDEAASSLAISDGFYPLHLNSMQTRIDKLTSSLPAQNGNKDVVLDDIAQLQATYAEDSATWQKQSAQRQELAKIQADIVAVEPQINQLEHDGKFVEADKLRKESLQELFTKREELTDSKVLQKRHIAELVATKLKISVAKIMQEKQEGVFDLLPKLQQHIFGQDEQLQGIVNLVAMTEAGFNRNPPPSFLLLGPSGVGKTETVVRLQSILDDGRRELIRIDMSEYKEGHTMSAVLGSPAGYVGYEDGSWLITKIKANPSAILLLDEIEKAHPNLHDLLLQMLEGRLTGRDNDEIDLSQMMIFMTSNSINPEEDFLPAVRGRVDETITYNKLSPDIMSALVHRQVEELNDKVLHDKDVVVTLSDDMIAALANEGYNEVLGARPLQQLFDRRVTTPLSIMSLEGKLKSGKYQLELDGLKISADESE